jgi:S-DNA-T family DNA segregation ATPase FtsK/SpoIIIE
LHYLTSSPGGRARGIAMASAGLALLLAGLSLGLSWGDWRTVGRGAVRAARVSARHGAWVADGLTRAGSTAFAPLFRVPPMDEAEPPPSARTERRAAEAARMPSSPARTTGPAPWPEPATEPKASTAPGPETAPWPAPAPQRAPPPVSPAREVPNVQLRKPAPPRQESLALPEEGWTLPPLSLLAGAPGCQAVGPTEEALQANARLLESVLSDYGVQGTISDIRPGPVVTLYELEPAPGIRSARVIGLADDVARSLSVTAVRIATVPGRNVIGIEVPNARRETVFLSELMDGPEWTRHQGRLTLALGKDIGGAPVVVDLARMPHLLIAGTTGSGK